ncbi:MFS transporter [Nonomuraea endophytica]|uniref:MFS family permease n=1 Tax=Nonomuraea endophytica TaxID=714136 RepID=A0A7W8ADV0_9ACTN|nr:MFS transporter [Nonomuraea endophytica]MBB5083241.1 MFS family permease [Nonomuraea endophytica]
MTVAATRVEGAWAGVFGVVGLAGFVTTLDNTVVTVAVPTMQRELGARLAAMEWVATGYVITFAGLMLAGGRLADLWGRRRVLVAGMAVFSAASLVAGLAGAVEVLVAARVVQGVGAAMVLPATLAVLAGVGERRRSAGIAVWMASGAAALALGPVVGGYLSEHAHWGWVFLINVPLGAAVIGLALVTLPLDPQPAARSHSASHPRSGSRSPSASRSGSCPHSGSRSHAGYRSDSAFRSGFGLRDGVVRVRGGFGGGGWGRVWVGVDVPGVVCSGVFLGAGTFVLIHGVEYGWARPAIVVGAVACLVAGVAFVVVERRAVRPMVDLALFRVRSFSGGVVAQVLWGLGVNGVFFYTAIFLQDVLGFTPSASGLAFMPLALLVVAVAPLVPWVERWAGAGRTVAAGLVLVAAGMVVAAFLGPGDGWVDLLPAVCAIGVGSALTMPLGSAVLGAVPEERAGVAGGVFSVSREVSGLFGIAGVGGVVHAVGTFAAGYTVGLLAAAALVLGGALVSVLSLP